MKKLNNDVELRKLNSQQKQRYEKPQVGKIELYADQVLALCNGPLGDPGGTCDQFPGSTT